MNKLEAQAIAEATGNYDEEDMEYIMNTYEELSKHIGFEDNRRDTRYIVKFHDVCYYTPYNGDNEEEFWSLFDMFCEDQAEWLEEENKTEGIDEELMLTRYNCGHYPAFEVNIPEITDKNAIEVAMNVYDSIGYRAPEYVDSYIFMVNNLQAMEDNYMNEWIEFLRAGEYMPEKAIKEMEDKYKSDQERRKINV